MIHSDGIYKDIKRVAEGNEQCEQLKKCAQSICDLLNESTINPLVSK